MKSSKGKEINAMEQDTGKEISAMEQNSGKEMMTHGGQYAGAGA